MTKSYIPDGKGGFIEKENGTYQGKYYVSDGQGGFVQKGDTSTSSGGSSGGSSESISFLVFVGLMFLTVPLFVGYILSDTIFLLITSFSTTVPVAKATQIYIAITIVYAIITATIYIRSYQNTTRTSKIYWAFVFISIVASPFMSLQSSYQNQVFSQNLSAEIVKIEDGYNPIKNSPSREIYIPLEGISDYYCWVEINSTLGGSNTKKEEDPCSQEDNQNYAKWIKYSIKNTDQAPISVQLRHFNSYCFTDSNSNELTLYPQEQKSFFCIDQIITGESPSWQPTNPCIAIMHFDSQNEPKREYRKLCSNNNWK